LYRHEALCKEIPCTCEFLIQRVWEIRKYHKQAWLAVAIFAGEIIGWWFSGSFAVASDSLHVLTDLAFYFVGVGIARRELLAGTDLPHMRKRGSYMHGALFLFLALLVGLEARERIIEDAFVRNVPWMCVGAVWGFFGNLLQMRISRKPTNVTEKWVHGHNIMDLLASFVVVCATPFLIFDIGRGIDGWASLGVACIMAATGLLALYEARMGHNHTH
jgi:Co/Zn/Cd efflux system component